MVATQIREASYTWRELCVVVITREKIREGQHIRIIHRDDNCVLREGVVQTLEADCFCDPPDWVELSFGGDDVQDPICLFAADYWWVIELLDCVWEDSWF